MKVILEHVACDFCGSKKYKKIFSQPDMWFNSYEEFYFQFPVVRCCECGLEYVNPRPTQESMGDFYPKLYHADRIPQLAGERYQKQLKFLPEIASGSKVLDIGCAKGDWLHWLRENHSSWFEAFGCDAFSGAVRARYNISFKPVQLPECQYESSFFDLATAWAVLEHVHTPSVYFSEVARVLKPDAKFVFLVPNSRSLYVRLAFKDDIPRHIYQFSEKSIRRYADKYGFHVEDCVYTEEIFDGRGHGAIARTLWRLAGGSWEDEIAKRSSRFARFAFSLGLKLDNKIFGRGWEAKFGVNGMMIFTLRK